MRTTLDVDKRLARILRELAAERALSVDQLLTTYMPGLRLSRRSAKDVEDAVPAFEQWAESFSQAAPPLPDEAISRTSIYRDR